MTGLEPADVLTYLRKAGITCHHVTALSNGAVLVYLEGALCQNGDAEEVLRSLPDTGRISYPSPGTKAIMRVNTR